MAPRSAPGVELAAFTRAARRHSKEALEVLAHLMRSAKDERVKNAAAARILDLSFGRPTTAKDPDASAAPPSIRILPGDDKL